MLTITYIAKCDRCGQCFNVAHTSHSKEERDGKTFFMHYPKCPPPLEPGLRLVEQKL